MMQSNNARERDVERRLGRVESPEPPANLLDRIRGDIPEHLRPVERAAGRAPARGLPYRLLAASLLLAAAGGLLAYRVVRQAAPPAGLAEPTPSGQTAAVEPQPVPGGIESEAAATPPAASAAPEGRPAAGSGAAKTGLSTPASPAPMRAAEEPSSERLREILKSTPDDDRDARSDRAVSEAEETGSELAGSLATALHEDQPRLAEAPEPATEFRDAVTVTAPPLVPAPKVSRQGATFSTGTAPADRARAPRPRLKELPRYERRLAPPVGIGPSTGGTAEPNDQPWGDMFFRPYGTNPFVDTEDDARSTFGLDVDTGSYTLARSYLERGHLPPPEAIRVEEFLNFFDYRDPAPRRGDFNLSAEGAPSPWARGPRYQLLRIGVRGREVAATHRRDATLIFVVDVSGSMARDNRLELVKRALHLLLGQLRSGDQVGLVVYGSRGQIVLEPTSDHPAVRRALDRLTTGGSTNAEEGLLLGYELARRHYRPESIHRLVLCSDGVANVGRTGPESILERVGREAGDGIELTTVGFGMGNYNDVLMEQLADRGDGNYAYVDTLDEARRVFVENLTGTLETIAADAKIQVEFDPRVVSRYRLLGYENRDIADHRFRDDTVDAGEIGAGHRVTALYEIKLADDAPRRRPLAEVRLRYRSRATGQVVEESLEVGREALARSWRAASPSLRLAALAAELAEVLKRSYWARETRPEELRQRARQVDRELGDDRDAAELARLARRAIDLVDWPEAAPE